MTRRSRTIWLGLVFGLVVIGIGVYLASSGAISARLFAREPQVERADAAPVIVLPIATQTPAATISPSALAAASTATSTPAPAHNIAITLDPATPSPSPTPAPVYTAFDFLQDYLTNRTYPNIIEATPWTNSSVNVQQYSQNLGGVTYWDFWSEHENWDSPFYMYQDDNGSWHPYQTVTVRNAAGQNVSAYLLVDRNGPGVMDKIWFTEDAVWMLETAQSRADVGLIADMSDFVEWGNLEKLGNLRIEVDDRVAYDGAIKDWFSGAALGLTPELAQILTWRHREYGSSGSIVPIPFQKHLRVLLYGGSKKPKWFMATGVRFADTTRVKPFEKTDLPIDQMTRLAPTVLQPERFIDALNPRAYDLQVDAQSPATLRFDGAGMVSAFQFRIAKKYDPSKLWLRVAYGNDIGIDLPLIAFFGDHTHLVLHRSAPLGAVESPDSYVFYSNLPLPFQNGLTITLENRGAEPIAVTVRVAASREIARAQLRVLYRPEEKLAVYGPDYHVDLPGDGKLVGLVLASEDQGLDAIPKIIDPKTGAEDAVKRAWSMGYLEGNLALLDGAGRSRLYGGHEDWADGGFYFNRGYTNPPGGSNRPFGGILRYKDGKDGYATIFRYFDDLSAFQFKNGLQMNLGHGTWNNNFPVKFGVTAYYYATTTN
ncbi:MAG: DUF2961 domain-containing protein [Chloroflexota bacterium]|nr:DUF2961 domain-containing protein [Chloroflexota bacterium]